MIEDRFLMFVETPKFCGGVNNRHGSFCSPTSYDESEGISETSLINVSFHLK